MFESVSKAGHSSTRSKQFLCLPDCQGQQRGHCFAVIRACSLNEEILEDTWRRQMQKEDPCILPLMYYTKMLKQPVLLNGHEFYRLINEVLESRRVDLMVHSGIVPCASHHATSSKDSWCSCSSVYIASHPFQTEARWLCIGGCLEECNPRKDETGHVCFQT